MARDTEWWLASDLIDADNCISAYQPVRAASYAYSKLNKAHVNEYDCVDGGLDIPTWTADGGWKFVRGSHQSLLPNGVELYMVLSIAVQFRNMVSGATNYLVGCYVDSNTNIGIAPGNDGYRAYRNGGYLAVTDGDMVNGNMIIAGDDAYHDGVAEESTITLGNNNTQDEIRIGYMPGMSGTYSSGEIIAIAFYSIALSAAQAEELAFRMGQIDYLEIQNASCITQVDSPYVSKLHLLSVNDANVSIFVDTPTLRFPYDITISDVYIEIFADDIIVSSGPILILIGAHVLPFLDTIEVQRVRYGPSLWTI